MPAVDQARDWIRDYPRSPEQSKRQWLEGVARFYRISFALCKKLYYREKKHVHADVYVRMGEIHAQFRDLQSRALRQRGNLNDIAIFIAEQRADQRTREIALSRAAAPTPSDDGNRRG